MDIIRLYDDYNVDYVTEGHKHARPGWVNTTCPWCTGNPGYHLGYNEDDNYYFCWRCGWHPISATLAHLIHLTEREVRIIIQQYGLRLTKRVIDPTTETNKLEFALPTGTDILTPSHRRYLIKRNFDPDKLERIWGLQSTGPASRLDGLDYKNRIVIPYYWEGRMVSFDTRSVVTDASHGKRYKACPKEREIIPHKEILYGRQEEWKETGILVEGPTDVWRMGTSSFAVSGIQYTAKQVRLISRTFKRVAVVFDDDPQAILQADKIVAELKFRGVDAFRVDINGDPGGMSQDEANYLVKIIEK